ncbi:MAG: hypothetical protein HUU26_01610 [Gemmatimonadaceae bacterium]|nr:hypothetical protein [Gemmatimonadaceae bacterium]
MDVRAALHVHSTYSDGELSLREVRELFLRDGCRVVFMADHADAFDADRLAAYAAECASLSDERLTLLPGLEFGCVRRMHVVGYGIVALPGSDDPTDVIAFIGAHGGVSVIAHPAPEHLPWIPTFRALPDGIEAWNTKYDGASAPRPAVFALIRQLQARRPGLKAFYGQDLHWRHQFRGLFAEMSPASAEREDLLGALRAGRFQGVIRSMTLPSDGDVSEALLAEFGARNARSRWIRAVIRRAKRMAGPIGRALPAGLKSQLRRFF